MTKKRYSREECLLLLNERAAQLERLPVRSDFSEDEVVAIKAFLGPWPRALEAAGLKEPPPDDRKQKNQEKRIRAKRLRNQNRKAIPPKDEGDQK